MLVRFFLLVFSVFLSLPVFAQKQASIPDRPEPKRFVNDLAGLLDEPKRTEALEYKLQKFKDSLKVEVTVITIKSLKNTEVVNFTRQLAEKWGDDYTKENGIFILFDYEDRGYAIIPGTNLQDEFTPTILKKIEAHYMVPHFKKKEFHEGFNLATDAIANHITGKLTDEELKTDDQYNIYLITLGIFVFFLILFPLYQYSQFKKQHFGTKKIGFISAFMLMNHFRPSHSRFEDFKKGTGPFSVSGSKVTSFGGGAGGSWGGW